MVCSAASGSGLFTFKSCSSPGHQGECLTIVVDLLLSTDCVLLLPFISILLHELHSWKPQLGISVVDDAY